MDKRKYRAIEQAKDRSYRSPHIERYLEYGSWRNINQLKLLNKLGRNIYNQIDSHPRRCYENAIKVVNALDSNNATYVEGFALPKQAGRISAHS